MIDSLPSNESALEVIVVDNHSDGPEASLIAQRYPNVVVISSKENLGFAGGNNLGIREAKGKYIFLINNDTVMKGSDKEKMAALRSLCQRLETPNIGVVCPKLRFSWGSNAIQFAGFTPLSKITIRNRSIGFGEEDHGQYVMAHPTPYAHGAAMMLKREVIEQAGLMPENYFLYYEEIDWSFIIRRSGFDIWYDPCCTIFHKESQSTGPDSPLKTYYLTRNRLMLVHRNMPWPGKFLSFIYLILMAAPRNYLKYLIKGQKAQAQSTAMGIYDFLTGKQGKRNI
jgi:GT2 family glycosyltransferase